MSNEQVYILPGRGEKFGTGLALLIYRAGYEIHGHEISGAFARLRFSEQLALISCDLQATSWNADAKLVARSYGAYLLLNTLAEMNPFPGRILLLSPVLGAAVANNGFFVSRPPRAERFATLVESGDFPSPSYLEIHTGAEDNGCDPLLAKRFASLVRNTKIEIVPRAGHQLDEEYLKRILAEFLSNESESATSKVNISR